MPRINPEELLTCLAVLLNPKGGIKSTLEVERIARLMARYSKKLVSKCIYVQVIKATDPPLQDLFLSAGGWGLISDWLKEGVASQNSPLCKEVLDMLLHVPLTAQKLINEGGEVAKMASKGVTLPDKECQVLCCELMKKWGEDLTVYLNGDVESAGRFLDYPLASVVPPETTVTPHEAEEELNNSVTESELKSDEEEAMPLLDFYPKSGSKKQKKKKKRLSECDDVMKSDNGEEFKGEVPILKFVRKSGKLATTLKTRDNSVIAKEEEKNIEREAEPEELPVVEVGPESKTLKDDEPPSKIEPKDAEDQAEENIKKESNVEEERAKLKSSDIKSERNEKEKTKSESKSSEKRNDKERSKESRDKDKDKPNSDRKKEGSFKSRDESSRKRDDKENSKRDDKESSSKKDDKESSSKKDDKESSSKKDDKYRKRDVERPKISGSSRDDKHRSSSSSKDKQKSDRDRERSENRSREEKKQSEIDQKTLESLGFLAKPGISSMKIPKKVKTDEEKKQEEEKKEAEKQKDNFSILDRKPASTVKVFQSKFRSHGCEEAPAKPPLKKTLKKGPPVVPPVLKRPSTSALDIFPPEKKLKSPLALLEDEEGKAMRPGGIKLISPRPMLQDSSLFMDALAAGTKEKKRKRKLSETEKDVKKEEEQQKVEEPEVNTSPRPEEKMEPVVSPPAVKPQFKFYKDILDEETDDSDDKPLAQLKREKEEREEREKEKLDEVEVKVEVKQEVVKMEVEELKDEALVMKGEDSSSSDEPSIEIGDLPPAPPVVFTAPVEEPAIPIAPAALADVQVTSRNPPPRVGGTKGVLVYHRPPNRVKKTIKWKVEEELHEFFYFELDETERVNVNRQKCQDIKQADKLMEKDAFIKSRKLHSEDIMEERIPWMLPPIYDLPEQQVQFVRGANSLDKEVQLARQAVTLETIFLSKNMIPSTPTEPDPDVPLERVETREIPLEELEPTPDSVSDHSHQPWPEPKFDLPEGPVAPFSNMHAPAVEEIAHNFYPMAGPPQHGPFPPGLPMGPGPVPGMMGPRPPMQPSANSGGTWMTGDGAVFQDPPSYGFPPNPMMSPFVPPMYPQYDLPMGPMPGMLRPNEMEYSGPSRGPRPPFRGGRDRGRGDYYRGERRRDGRRDHRDPEDRYRGREPPRSSKPCLHYMRGFCKFEDKCLNSHAR